MSKEQVTVFDSELVCACDDFIEAKKKYDDAKDYLECCVKTCAKLMKKSGLGDKQEINHDGYTIVLNEGKVTEDTVRLRRNNG